MNIQPAEAELRRPDRRALLVTASLLIGLAALLIADTAHAYGRPVTVALVCVFGVVAIASLLGLRAGVIAGLSASLAYNMLFTEPFGRFTIDSLDDLVPIVALNVSAIATGLIAGRLRDRAVAAETSTRRVEELLKFSEDLQSAVTLAQVQAIVRNSLRTPVQLFFQLERELVSPRDAEFGERAARELWDSLLPELRHGDDIAFLLTSSGQRLGILVVRDEDGAVASGNIRLWLPLLALALLRCILAEQLNKADVIRRSEQFKTTLLSSVSHDLRTPLASIAASASSLASLGSELDEDTKMDLLATIQEQCDRLDRLTGNLLNLGRIEGGLAVDEMPVVDAVEVLGMALSRARKLSSVHDFQRDFQIGSAGVRADEPLLEQVFFNVLQNATVHASAGPVRVSAGVSGCALIVSVEDDGPGIPLEIRERVFDRFYQANDRRKARSGSGLGLPIAKGFAEIIGGTITAGPAVPPLRGARIEIALPIDEVPVR
jgi:two-component system sensor histidine kinase KdpD